MHLTLLRSVACCAMICAITSASTADAGFVLTANPAGSQSSLVSGVTTVDFESADYGHFSQLVTSIGTLNADSAAIIAADGYGGAGGSGKYLATGAQSGGLNSTLTLNAPQSYFGFWWSAADSQNQIEFLSGGNVVASFDPTTALGALDDSYFGNPNSGADSWEKFAYLNFYGTDGSTFDAIRFTNLSYGTGFETDNWSVLATQVTPEGPIIDGGVNPAVPEPSTMVLSALGFTGLLGFSIRRSRTAINA